MNMSKSEVLIPAFPTCFLLQANSTVAHSVTQTPDLKLIFLYTHIWAFKWCFHLYLQNHS